MHTEDKKEEQMVQELLKPRYKVIADYPAQFYSIGDVIDTDNPQLCSVCEDEFWLFDLGKYPHLFHKLEWYEEREEKDMPQYVKCLGIVRKFKQWHREGSERVQLYDYPGEIDYEEWISKEEIEKGYEIFDINDCAPATLTDYTLFIEKSKK